MPFEVADGKITELREGPLATSRSKRVLFQGIGLGEPVRASEGWLLFDWGPEDDRNGWVVREDCVEITGAPRPALNEVGFVTECVIAEWKFTASEAIKPSVVSGDYLIARAIIETGLTNAAPMIPNSDGLGPLQVTTKEWKDFLDHGGELASGMRPGYRNYATLQIDGAAFRMFSDAKKMSELQNSPANDPFVPSYLDLFFAYLTDSPAAALAIRDMRAANPNPDPTIDTVLKQPHGPFTDAELAALFQARKRFFLTGANPKTLGSVVNDVKTELGAAFVTAFAKVKQHMPEAEPDIGQGGAPWFDVAETEEGKNVDATKSGSKNTILDYFNATDHPRPSSIEPWCGAFAAHCMKASQDDTAAASIPTGAAAAASWKSWGDELSLGSTNLPPKGAVVVLSPSSQTGGTGHVGFFVEFSNNGKSVKLLGGNQSKRVTRTDFPKEQIASIRWLQLPGANAGQANFNLPPAFASRQHIADKIVAKFAAAGYGTLQQIAALANAMAESSLNPDEHNTGEDSVGLFQLRRILGVGGNHSVEDLKNPDFNIDLIIAEAKKYSVFAKAESLTKTVDAFVRYIERPKRIEHEVEKRVGIARSLIGQA